MKHEVEEWDSDCRPDISENDKPCQRRCQPKISHTRIKWSVIETTVPLPAKYFQQIQDSSVDQFPRQSRIVKIKYWLFWQIFDGKKCYERFVDFFTTEREARKALQDEIDSASTIPSTQQSQYVEFDFPGCKSINMIEDAELLVDMDCCIYDNDEDATTEADEQELAEESRAARIWRIVDRISFAIGIIGIALLIIGLSLGFPFLMHS